MDSLAFIANRAQWESFCRRGELLDGCVVASMDYEVTLELTSKHTPVIDLFKYLDGQVTARIWAEALSWCDAFAKTFQRKFLYRGCDIASVAQDDLLFPFLCLLTAQTVVSRALEEHRPRCVIHFGEMCQIPDWDRPDPPPDIFNAVVAACASGYGLNASQVAIRHAGTGYRPGYATIGENKSVDNRGFEPFLRCHPTLSFCGAYHEQQLFLKKISQEGRCDFFLMSYEGQDRLPQMSLHTTGCLRFDMGAYREPWRRQIIANRSKLPSHAPALAEALTNSHWSFFWENYLNLLLSCARSYALGLFLHRTLSPKTVITSYDFFGAVRCFQKAMTDQGVKVISVDHVGMGDYWAHLRNRKAFSDVTVWGDHDRHGQLRWRKEGASVIVVGSLRQDHAHLNPHKSGETKKTPSSGLHVKRQWKIILFTTRLTYLFGTVVNTPALQRSWDQLFELFHRHPKWDVIVKPHPNYDYHFYYKSPTFLRLSNVKVIYASPAEVLADVDVAVLHNSTTTVVLDAIGMNVPVIYLNDAVPQELPPSPFEQHGLILIARSVEELESQIESLLASESWREEILTKQEVFFRKILAATGSEAAGRMLEVVSRKCSLPPEESSSEDGLALFNLVLFIDALRFRRIEWAKCRKPIEKICSELPTSEPERFGLRSYADLGEELLVAIAHAQKAKGFSLSPFRFFSIFRILPKEYRPTFSGLRNAVSRGCSYLKKTPEFNFL